ncbi:MAG: hypothetical protein ACR2PY_01035 [Salinispira sp.]
MAAYIKRKNGIADKALLAEYVREQFKLTRDRTVYYSEHFALRFSVSASNSFSNTVLSLSTLRKYDERPFIVCLVTPNKNILYMANSTFLQKISHSSQDLRIDNIRGSFNGADIMREFNGLKNSPENFEKLFAIHQKINFTDTLNRLVAATTNIVPSGSKFEVSATQKACILSAPERTLQFTKSNEYITLTSELNRRVNNCKDEILKAVSIENVNIRGRVIEYLIIGEDENVRGKLRDELRKHVGKPFQFETKNELGDYTKFFDDYHTAVDVKTKKMVLKSSPKAYNIDKFLRFLSDEKSVFMFYFIGIRPNKIAGQALVSVFQTDLLNTTDIRKHWAGRNSRGVAQFHGETIRELILKPNNDINIAASKKFLRYLITLV